MTSKTTISVIEKLLQLDESYLVESFTLTTSNDYPPVMEIKFVEKQK